VYTTGFLNYSFVAYRTRGISEREHFNSGVLFETENLLSTSKRRCSYWIKFTFILFSTFVARRNSGPFQNKKEHYKSGGPSGTELFVLLAASPQSLSSSDWPDLLYIEPTVLLHIALRGILKRRAFEFKDGIFLFTSSLSEAPLLG